VKQDDLDDLIGSFRDIPIVDKDGYQYFVHPLSDGIPLIDPAILKKTAGLMSDLIPNDIEYDILVTAEAMGIPLTTMISALAGAPFSIVRKRDYGLEGERTIIQSTGYSRGKLFINLPREGGSCIIVDDVLSTGGTMRSMIMGIRESGLKPIGAIILVDKMGSQKRAEIEREFGIWIRPLLYVDIEDGLCDARPAEFIEMD